MIRRQIISILVVSILFSLVVSSSYAQTKKNLPATVSPKITVETIKMGEQLLLKSDCFACHKVDSKLIGPSYLEIAKKYPANESNYSYLAAKIIKGGSGTWGQIPMSPHPQMSVADAKKIAIYILSVKESK